MHTIPKPEDRREWLKVRHTGVFNASDAGVLYGVHPHRNLADVAVEKLSPEPPDTEQTEAMDRGVRLEPVLLDWLGDQLGVAVTVPDVLYVNGKLMATLDGEMVGNDEEWVEAKSTSYHWPEPPEHVYFQVCAQAAASGRKRCHVVWLDASMRIQSCVIKPEPEHVADVLDRAQRFMDFIDLGMTPSEVEFGYDHIKQLFPSCVPDKAVALDDDNFTSVVRWNQLREARLAVEKDEKAARDEVARLLGDAAVLTFGDVPVVTFRNARPSASFDMAAFRAAHPDLVEKFTVSKPGARRLLPTTAARA